MRCGDAMTRSLVMPFDANYVYGKLGRKPVEKGD